jgi:hypothetical protein
MNSSEFRIDNPSEEQLKKQFEITINRAKEEMCKSESFLLVTSILGSNSKSIIFGDSNIRILDIYKHLVEEVVPILESKLKESGMTSDMIQHYVHFPKNHQF